jgi:gliding motility-associated-like protein
MRYRWTPTSYLDNPNNLQPQIEQPQSDVSYVLTATGKGNCISRDTVKLTSLNILNPPNTLVPGRPPYDKWVIANIQKYTDCVLKIFDVNGRLVKSYDNGYDNNLPWNGTRDKTGEYLPAGTYYYILDPKNGRKIQTGYVTIHR